MRLVRNAGSDRVLDVVRSAVSDRARLDAVTRVVSLFALNELSDGAGKFSRCRFVLPPPGSDLGLLGSAADRAARNRLQTRWIASRAANWIRTSVEVRRAPSPVPQGTFVIRDSNSLPVQSLLGSVELSTEGLGLAPGNPLNLIQASETPEEAALL